MENILLSLNAVLPLFLIIGLGCVAKRLHILSDEAAAYFAGEKSLDDTANMIQSRVNLYVAEQS